MDLKTHPNESSSTTTEGACVAQQQSAELFVGKHGRLTNQPCSQLGSDVVRSRHCALEYRFSAKGRAVVRDDGHLAGGDEEAYGDVNPQIYQALRFRLVHRSTRKGWDEMPKARPVLGQVSGDLLWGDRHAVSLERYYQE